ncbi:hypothetical protein BDN72DRAFT_846363 [Pluteus cervinus]|uniref:Uncharacterized protein n=1 Tax=Pluteus cervinus TaxID=181527 RepID=A0ACD3AGI1_9AGAR|nr:hypothetical protein BDN72DRAFT_846363 [Pluteus cervinus]
MTAQSRALGIPEILELILNHVPINEGPKHVVNSPRPPMLDSPTGSRFGFSPPIHPGPTARPRVHRRPQLLRPSRTRGKGILLAVALSCRCFTLPALRVLWRTMYSIDPLISLLPIVNLDGQRTLAPQISPEKWARFDLYRHLIRVLSVNHLATEPVSGLWSLDPVWTTIIAIKPLPLPHLHTLIITEFNHAMTPNVFAPFLASPLLQTIQVGKISNRGTFLSFCSLFHHVAPSPLHALLVGQEGVSPATLKLVTSPALRTLQTHLAEASTFQALDNLPLLQHLQLHLSGDMVEVCLQTLSLPSLRLLHISGDIASITGFLSTCECDLERISIKLPSRWHLRDSPGGTPGFLLGLVSTKWAHSLRHLDLWCNATPTATNDLWDNLNFMDMIKSLSSVPLLTLRILDSPFKLGSDTSIVTVASYFPHIQALSLPCSKQGAELTFDELSKIGASCPSLRHLGASVALQGSVLPPIVEHGLKTLDVLNSLVMGTLEDTALGLDRIFPSLSNIRCSIPEEDVCWTGVERFLKLIRRVREQ